MIEKAVELGELEEAIRRRRAAKMSDVDHRFACGVSLLEGTRENRCPR